MKNIGALVIDRAPFVYDALCVNVALELDRTFLCAVFFSILPFVYFSLFEFVMKMVTLFSFAAEKIYTRSTLCIWCA